MLTSGSTQNQTKNLHYACGITPTRVTSGGAYLSGLAPGQQSSEETLQRWRAVGQGRIKRSRGPVQLKVMSNFSPKMK